MAIMEIAWDDRSEGHIARHNVTPWEVEEVVGSRPLIHEKGRGGTRYIFGQTYSGRPLFVVLAQALDGRVYVVTARDMTLMERRKFRRIA